MFDDKNIVDSIMEHPSAALILQRLQEKLDEEQKRRQEFYALIDEKDKVEFINGEIIFHSPVSKEHNDAAKRLLRLLDTYVGLKQLGYVGIEKIMTRFSRNDYEPDLCFFGNEKAQGFAKGQKLFPTPDLAVEILSPSPKSLQRDRQTKFEDYELHGVAEYWIIDPETESLEQYILHEGRYELALKSGDGMLRSQIVPGFAIPIRAIFEEQANLTALASILQQR
jgi:Uma2 family endonuclease